MLIVSTASAAFAQMDALLLGAFLSTAAVGIYAAPLRLIGFLSYPVAALAQGVGAANGSSIPMIHPASAPWRAGSGT